MKQNPPLFCNLRNILCAAGVISALGVFGLCPAAYAESAQQSGDTQAVPSATQPAEVSSAQLKELSSAAGESTSQLVGEIQGSLARGAIASSYVDPAADELPVVPYALGAGTAVLGIGIFAGIYAAVRHARRGSEESGESGVLLQSIPATVRDMVDDTASFVALFDGNTSQGKTVAAPADSSVQSTSAQGCGAAPDASPSGSLFGLAGQDEADDLERFAMGYATSIWGTPASGSHLVDMPATDVYETALSELNQLAPSHQPAQVEAPCTEPEPDPDDGPGGCRASKACESKVAQAFSNTDLTMPFRAVNSPQSIEEFSATAKALATGTGKVHRVNTPSDHLDFSGMDVLSNSNDTYHDAPAANPLIEYDDWRAVALNELSSKPGDPEQHEKSFSTEELVSLIQTQSQPARTPKRQGFVAPVIGPGIDSVAAARRQEMMRASSSPAAALLVNRDNEFIARRTGQSQTSCSKAEPRFHPQPSAGVAAAVERRGPQACSSGRPGPASGVSTIMSRVGVDVQSQGVPTANSFVAPRPPTSASVVSDRGLAAAVAAASSAYAAFRSYTDAVTSPVVVADDGGASRAALYASAVYGAPEQPRSHGTVPAAPHGVSQTDIQEQAGATDPYIDYIVQDEFDHRHDSLAQRNAALGRIQVVDGAASPISVRESMRRHRA